jgi:hypothetical protein
LDGVSAQIQCSGLISSSIRRRRRNLLSAFESAPYTQVSMVVSNTLQKNDIDTLMKFFLIAHGYNCSEVSAMSGYQPYNRAADMQDANIPVGSKGCSELVPCIIESAGKNMRKNLSLAVPEEYLISWTLQNSSLVNALAKLKPITMVDSQTLKSTGDMIDKEQAAQCGISDTIIETLVRSKCMIWLNSDFHLDWLPCVLGILNGSSTNSNNVVAAASGRRRRLLQATTTEMTMITVLHAQGTFVSSTTITWGVLSQSKSASDNGNNNGGGNKNTQNNNNNGNDSNMFMIVIVAGAVGGLLITILIVGILYMYFFKTTSQRMIPSSSIQPTTSSNIMMYHNNNNNFNNGALYFPLYEKSR